MPTEAEKLMTAIAALDNPIRLRIVAVLSTGRQYVSELSRRLVIRRPMLYLQRMKLGAAEFVSSKLEIADDGNAMKYYELRPFELKVSPAVITKALAITTRSR